MGVGGAWVSALGGNPGRWQNEMDDMAADLDMVSVILLTRAMLIGRSW